jgi:Na+-transporting methylmalonyl-CoA/oxaloacetate decarboxylase gamma subunit
MSRIVDAATTEEITKEQHKSPQTSTAIVQQHDALGQVFAITAAQCSQSERFLSRQ